MNRRSILLGFGTAAAGAGAVFGSGAFTQVQADRDLTVRVDEDSNALLGITAGSNVASVYKDSGELAINTDELSAEGEQQGFAVGSTVSIGGTNESGDVTTPAFTITNNFDELDANTEGVSSGLNIAIDLTNIDLDNSALTQLTFVGTPTSGTTQVTAAGERNVFEQVSATDSIEFAIEFKTASTGSPEPLDSTITFQAGSDLTSDDFPTEDPGDPIRIADWNDLDAVRDDPAASYILANDLDSTTPGYNTVVGTTGSGFDPIGVFYGTFDGKGHTIGDLRIDRPDTEVVGLFRAIDNGTVKNLDLANISINGLDGVGAVAGAIQNGGTTLNVSITGLVESQSTAGASADLGTGGICGVFYGGKISDSKTDIEVKAAQYAGGITGKMAFESTISKCGAAGNVTGKQLGGRDNGLAIGGLVGFVNSSSGETIKNAYAIGDVTGTEKTGGLVAEVADGLTLENTLSGGKLEITDGGSPEGGGLISSGTSLEISNSYFDNDRIDTDAKTDPGTGLSTSDIQGTNAIGNLSGFDFDSIWTTVDNDYPDLQSIE